LHIGGDKFAAVIIEDDMVLNIRKIILDLEEKLKEPWYIDQREIFVTFNIGVATYPENSSDLSKLLYNAELAMYH
jgi:GGDEF domain-containing protein